jgi:hypothetical protein
MGDLARSGEEGRVWDSLLILSPSLSVSLRLSPFPVMHLFFVGSIHLPYKMRVLKLALCCISCLLPPFYTGFFWLLSRQQLSLAILSYSPLIYVIIRPLSAVSWLSYGGY